MTRKGCDLLAGSLKACGAETFFYLTGGPMTQTMELCIAAGLRGIDVRDERAAAFAAVAYSRVKGRPAVVLSAAGPGTTNTVTGVSHAYADGSPVIVIGGSVPMYQRDLGAFQETDQMSLMRPITKWAYQVQTTERIPESVLRAFQVARTGSPGPVYLDMPADVLNTPTERQVTTAYTAGDDWQPRSMGDPRMISQAVELLARSHRPIVIAGSGVLWSRAWDELRRFMEASGIPVYTTPMARGVVPEDHPLCLPAARSTAFREADCLLVVGTRVNYILNWLGPPIMSKDARVIALNLEAEDLSHHRVADVAILADAKLGLQQLREGFERLTRPSYSEWTGRLSQVQAASRAKASPTATSSEVPIHPLRLCADLDRLLPHDAILVADGHEILGFSRRGTTARLPAHSLSPGFYGTMGVGMPFGVGAKVADPSTDVVVLTGDGAFGYHAMELDTAVRHHLGMVVVVSNNGGWTGARDGRPGRDLGLTGFEALGDVVGCWGRKVCAPDDIAPAFTEALAYARREQKPALLNVIVSTAQAGGRIFTQYDPV